MTPRFNKARDIRFFETISRELVDEVIKTKVVLYKLVVSDLKTNIYGEALNKTYYKPIETTAIIERDDTEANYDGLGPDIGQSVEFRFNRFTLKEVGFYPEIGDIVHHNNAYFEISNVREDQLVGGMTAERFSIICSTFMTRRSSLNIEPRNI